MDLTLQRHDTEDLAQIFPEKNCAATVPIPIPYIHVSVGERFIYSQARSAYLLQENRWTDHGNIDT